MGDGSQSAHVLNAAPRVRTARSGELLNLVRRGHAQTTSELAAQMGWARSTVTERVDLLLRNELLKPSAGGASRRGRPPTVLQFNPDAGVVLAVQVGVSGSRLAITNLDTEVLWSQVVDMGISSDPDHVLPALRETFVHALDEIGTDVTKVRGIGIGVPGKVELVTASPESTRSAQSWLDYPIAQQLAGTFDVPAWLDQDVNLLALGEQRASWPDADVFLCVKVGTVIGCGVVVNGSVVRGTAGLAGEIGHTHVPGRDEHCACGNSGCLNVVAGGGALADALSAAGHEIANARDVARCAREGLVPAAQAVRRAGRDVGEVIAGAINLLNPEVISVWGYLGDAHDHLFTGLREGIYNRAVPAATQRLHVERARFGDEAGVRGAAMVVVEHVLDPEAIDAYVGAKTATT